ncbi:leucine-rich repeat extensin-like protein 5 [Larimichthys crocea]|uniref:leucine-rich repeat extensin-like protein 5 n=1 Tax=Larimichthys crocea TaxID=215358 RepID=UPI000F5F71F1|nr:leucine-rich repeat extensin-like protein 5 [Larimichthys crocea]
MPIPQSIVSVYSHIRQLLEDSRAVLDQTSLVLVPVNNTTVSSWLLRRDKRKDRDMLLQGTVLPRQLHLAKESLPAANALPAAPVQHGHEVMTFEEPENHEGEAFSPPAGSGGEQACVLSTIFTSPVPSTVLASSSTVLASSSTVRFGPAPPAPPQYGPAPPAPPQFGPAPPQFGPAPPAPPQFGPALPFQQAPYQQACLPPQPRQRAWRLKKSAQEDEEQVAQGVPPRKRLANEHYHYTCKECGQDKNKRTGHTQLKGRWYCPASGLTLDQWKNSL